MVDYLSSDYHARGHCLMAQARELLEARGGGSLFNALMTVNGDRMMAGLDPTPIPLLPRAKSGWQRLKTALGL